MAFETRHHFCVETSDNEGVAAFVTCATVMSDLSTGQFRRKMSLGLIKAYKEDKGTSMSDICDAVLVARLRIIHIMDVARGVALRRAEFKGATTNDYNMDPWYQINSRFLSSH